MTKSLHYAQNSCDDRHEAARSVDMRILIVASTITDQFPTVEHNRPRNRSGISNLSNGLKNPKAVKELTASNLLL